MYILHTVIILHYLLRFLQSLIQCQSTTLKYCRWLLAFLKKVKFSPSSAGHLRHIAVVMQDGGTTRLYAPEMWYKRIMHSALIKTTVLQQSLTNLLAQLHCTALRQHHKTKSDPAPCSALS